MNGSNDDWHLGTKARRDFGCCKRRGTWQWFRNNKITCSQTGLVIGKILEVVEMDKLGRRPSSELQLCFAALRDSTCLGDARVHASVCLHTLGNKDETRYKSTPCVLGTLLRAAYMLAKHHSNQAFFSVPPNVYEQSFSNINTYHQPM